MSTKVIARALLDNTTLGVRDANQLAVALVEEMQGEIASGVLKIPGLGTFVVVQREQREGINPRTKQPYVTPRRKVVRFKPSARLNMLINGRADVVQKSTALEQ